MTEPTQVKQMRGFSPAMGLAVCYLAYTSIYVARLNLTMASPDLISGGFLTATQIGVLTTVFSVIYAAGRLINSALADRVTPWVMVASGLLAGGLANVCSGFLPAFLFMAVLWGINAYGQSMLWGSCLRIVSAVDSPERAKRRMAIMSSTLAAGNILGILLNTWLISSFGVRFAYLVPGAINIVLAPAVWYGGHKAPFRGKSGEPIRKAFRLFVDPKVRVMLAPAFLHGVMKDNINAWMALYFVSFFGIDLKQSAWFVLLIPTVGLVGRLSYTPIYRTLRRNENSVSLAAFALCAAAAAALLWSKIPPLAAAVCLSLIFAAISLINTTFLSIFPLRFSATGDPASVSGIMDFVTYLGAGISSTVYGVMIEKWGNAGYTAMFLSWAVISALSAVLTYFAKRKFAAEAC